jgi:hypothetical protein
MLLSMSMMAPIEILIQSIFYQYLTDSYCISVVSEEPLEFIMNISHVNVSPNVTNHLAEQLLELSEMGCSDYVVRLRKPRDFMIAFEKVNLMGNIRRSDRKVILLPFNDDNQTRTELLNVLTLKETSFVANLLLILPKISDDDCLVYDLVTHKYVGPDKDSSSPFFMDQWDSCKSPFQDNVNLFPHDMTNLFGKTFKVACFTYKPYALLDIDSDIEPLQRDGTELRIVDEFCRYSIE